MHIAMLSDFKVSNTNMVRFTTILDKTSLLLYAKEALMLYANIEQPHFPSLDYLHSFTRDLCPKTNDDFEERMILLFLDGYTDTGKG